MKNKLLFLVALLFTISVNSQDVVDFEELTLSPESHWNGSDLSGSFTSKYLTFYNSYDTACSSWMGWAYTNETDNTTYDWNNCFSSAYGSGENNSENYAVSFIGSDWMNNYEQIPSIISINKSEISSQIASMSMSVCLNANAYLYITNDDFYQNNNHYLMMKISAVNSETGNSSSQNIYLADFRAETTEPFAVNNWKTIDMTWAIDYDSLVFTFESSDSGDYGINTPAYFCLDNFTYNTSVFFAEDNFQDLNVYTYDNNLIINNSHIINKIEIYDILGKKQNEKVLNNYSAEYNISNFPEGFYFVRVYSAGQSVSKKIIKR